SRCCERRMHAAAIRAYLIRDVTDNLRQQNIRRARKSPGQSKMTPSLMPHAVCWSRDPSLIWTMAVTNAITFVSYFSICFTLFYMARRTRRSIYGEWGFFLVGFALFIVACGSTHLMEVVTTWIPVFWVDSWTNII